MDRPVGTQMISHEWHRRQKNQVRHFVAPSAEKSMYLATALSDALRRPPPLETAGKSSDVEKIRRYLKNLGAQQLDCNQLDKPICRGENVICRLA